ncbi:hypothetical protein [Methylobacterium sp. JK268]
MLDRLKGWRTLAIFSPILALSLLEQLQAIDLTPLFAAMGIAEPSRAAILTGMSVLAVVLRVLTSTPVAGSAPRAPGGQP